MEVQVKNISGQTTGRSAKLNESIFGAEPNDHAIWLDVKSIMANKRQGTHKSKERNEVSGSTKKIKKQKGTGGARAGSMKSPVFVGGGRVFGPRPKDYSFKLNKKVKVLARISALSYKAKENNITVVENFSMDSPKTKQVAEIISKLDLKGKKVLFVVQGSEKNVFLSTRNLERGSALAATDINTYDILKASNLVITEGALPVIENTLLK